MTASQVIKGVIGFWDFNYWDPRKVCAVIGSTGLVGWEADILVLTDSGYLVEIEVKTSMPDFRREFHTKSAKHRVLSGVAKPRFDPKATVGRYYFAVPASLVEKVRQILPDYAGLIAVKEREDGRFQSDLHKNAPLLPGAVKVPAEFKSEMHATAYFAYWNLRHRLGKVGEVEG